MKRTDGFTAAEWRVARALYNNDILGQNGLLWERTPSMQKQYWLNTARLAIDAYTSTPEQKIERAI